MAEVVLGATVETIISESMNAVMKLIKLGWNSDENLKELEKLLNLIKPYVLEAQRNSTSQTVKTWLHDLETEASRARDVLDGIAEEEADRIANKQLCACLCFKISSSAHRLKVASKIEDIKESLKKIVEVGTALALQSNVKLSGPESSSSSVQVEETKPYLGDPELVANREVDVSIVVNMLIGASNSSHALPVVSIVGMAGLGKTTLAKMVLRDDRLKSLLETRQRLWVCVSNTFDVKKILCQILESLSGQPATSFESLIESTIVDKIKKELKERPFILVLDDVWNNSTEKWNDLMGCLLEIIDQKNKSIILATTRDEEVASTTRSQESMHRISKLNDNQCWFIIKAKSFGKFSVVPEDLEFIGRDIAGKCKGVALVASVVGGTMQKKKTKDEWSSIQNSDLWSSLQSNEEILKILRLSYDRLGSRDLQMCFAFCSIFPEDDILYKDNLIQLWMAVGFLHASPANYCPTAWDTGSKYFGELVSNSLFQDVEEDIYGYIQTCKMHDLVHCLARSLSEAMVLTSGTNSFIGVSSILHLNIIGGQREIATMLERDDAPKLQSLFANIDVFCHMPKKCRRLRALKLNDGDTNKLPESIGELKTLSYFDISDTQVEKLPGSFIKLQHLQTLNVERCWDLKQLPKGMENLVELSHFYFDKEELMPSNIGKLTCLQTLPLFFVGAEKGRLIEELGSLSHLRGRLGICNLEVVRDKDEAKMAKLHEKKGIYELELEWNEERVVPLEKGVVEGLQPHLELRDLCIINYKGNSFPSWLSFTSVHSSQCPLPNLTKLMLDSCTNCVKLPSLGDLPKLTYLTVCDLRAVKSIGNDFYGNAKFPALKEIVLSRMESLEEWVGAIERKSFPLLEKLSIMSCSNLRSMPSINDLPHLKEVNISDVKLSRMDLEDGLSSLEKLELGNCLELESISLKNGLPHLKELNISRSKLSCMDIEDGLSSLEKLELKDCVELKSILLKNGLPCLQDIDISRCRKLISIGDGLSSCKCLRKIRISSCINLKFLPRFHELRSLENLRLYGNVQLCAPHGLECCTSLQVLAVTECYNMSWRLEDLERLAALSYFRVSGNISWGEPPAQHKLRYHVIREKKSKEFEISEWCQIQKLDSQQILELSKSVMQILDSTPQILRLSNFTELEALPDWLHNFSSLEELWIRGCLNLKNCSPLEAMSALKRLSLPAVSDSNFDSICQHIPSSLQMLTLNGRHDGIHSLPLILGNLSSLKELVIRDCSDLRDLSALKVMPSLKYLTLIADFERFPPCFDFIHQCVPSSLQKLTLDALNFNKVKAGIILPPQIQHLTALKILGIKGFREIEALPDWLGNLSSLQRLEIRKCDNLMYMPSRESMLRLSNLKYLKFVGCYKMLERCKEGGDEWPKISHIPDIVRH